MSVRSVRDTNGVVWQVWEAVLEKNTETFDASRRDPIANAACLVFKSGSARRRLMPVPDGWETASAQRLEQMCRIAEPIDPGVLAGLVASGQLLVTAIRSGTPSANPAELVGAAIAAEHTVKPWSVDHVASNAYQPQTQRSRTSYRG